MVSCLSPARDLRGGCQPPLQLPPPPPLVEQPLLPGGLRPVAVVALLEVSPDQPGLELLAGPRLDLLGPGDLLYLLLNSENV